MVKMARNLLNDQLVGKGHGVLSIDEFNFALSEWFQVVDGTPWPLGKVGDRDTLTETGGAIFNRE